MRIARPIFTSILVLMILSSGLPVFSPEDANRDSRVNLEDAILNVRDFARTADDIEAFSSELGKAIITLKVVAGLKTYYKPANDSTSSNFLSNLNLIYIIPSIDILIPSERHSQVSIVSSKSDSISVLPETPPPQTI